MGENKSSDFNIERNPDGKTALITGASRGIGAAIAIRLAKAGYRIWLNYKQNDEAAAKICNEITALQSECLLLKFDVCNEDEIKQVLDPHLENTIPDVLINNAGFNRDSLMMWMTKQDWQSVIDVNLLGFYLVTNRVLLGMMKRRSGRIINITSTAGQSGLPGQVNYSAAKAGLIGATKSLAAEVAKKGVIVNAIAPGFIDTEMTAKLPKEQLIQRIPAGRLGTADEVAAVAEFLCSDDAKYIIGEVISVNGGLYM